MSEVLHGACLCGGVTFDVSQPEVMGACHCTRCQRWTGGSGSMVVVATPSNFKLTKGQSMLKTFHEPEFAARHFCSNCGSGIYVDGGEKFYIAAGLIKNLTMKPAFHIQVAYKASWDEIGGNAPQFPEWPPS